MFQLQNQRRLARVKEGRRLRRKAHGYGSAPRRASGKGAKFRLFPVLVAALASACQTVVVAPAPTKTAIIAPWEAKLRQTAQELLMDAVRNGWAPQAEESLADVLLNGRAPGIEPIEGVEAYLAHVPKDGISVHGRLERDVMGARLSAARLSDGLAAALVQGASSPAGLAEDLRLTERAVISLRRGETLFSAASARIAPASTEAVPHALPAAWELELLRAELKRLSEEIDRLADLVMHQQSRGH